MEQTSYISDVLLVPTHTLDRDVRSVAGNLGFSITDISYIISKPYPFVYMYDQWLKRYKRDARLSNLLDAVRDIKRNDAAEIVENAIKGMISSTKHYFFGKFYINKAISSIVSIFSKGVSQNSTKPEKWDTKPDY